ncbi:hypothetical protein ACTIVE_1771 [Actinomadura verrucosospora]|uniref:Uncharacterized protein n=1 Tax=Actinomadura verrucosospora TaxID=46165 RepID=A0A7D3VQ54_ACTVE|nr:hypothetical protein ACTIVE_1771 [Actinomadura verrucosospora]
MNTCRKHMAKLEPHKWIGEKINQLDA